MTDRIEVPANARSRRTRSALLAAARSLLEEGGSAALTMTATANAAGVTRRTVYLHFPTRSDLLVGLFDHVSAIEGLTTSLAPVWDAADSVAALDEWARHLGRFHPRIRTVAQAINRDRRLDTDAAAHWDVVIRDQHRVCGRLIRWLHREHRLARPWTVHSANDMLWALMSYDLLEELTIDRGWSTRRYADHLAALVRAAFVSDPPGGL